MKSAKINLLDDGYVKDIEAWGTGEDGKISQDFEVGIIEAARMSTGKGFNGWTPNCNKCGYSDGESVIGSACPFCDGKIIVGDTNLLSFLYNNKHATPFEMAGLVIEVKAPIFIFREWHRHRTQSYNEMSARYIPLPDENYMPTVERCMTGANTATTNKQASTGQWYNLDRRQSSSLAC